ncbi:alpha/beta family hydrolase [Marinomonas transparens]|uniref:Dienelactone hydrolase family protein n=1 Tax=Marinomonas transparens TaxID=2795388 RepID=A0A934JTX4_9GAMM|nr:alpha/beta family hydrolase [Marinomonas transparens]MBJ7538232.1 dienelactone hydrolase family protein [Marinomonas transparens]
MSPLPFYLAHGAGVGHHSDFLQLLSASLSKEIARVSPVTFAYMQEQERIGKKRPPPRFDKLVPEFSEAIKNEQHCIVAGKSMGGRVATQLSHLSMVKGIICFGFPFYPSGKPEKHRLSFLDNLETPCLIFQGTRDALGSQEWVTHQNLPKQVQVVWIEGADHDFKVLKKLNRSLDDTVSLISSQITIWLAKNHFE